MDTIFINCENRKTFKPHVLILKLTDKLDLRRSEKSIALSNLRIYYIWKKKKKMKTSYSNNKLKILVPKWSDEFELPGGSYFISDVQDYFEYI